MVGARDYELNPHVKCYLRYPNQGILPRHAAQGNDLSNDYSIEGNLTGFLTLLLIPPTPSDDIFRKTLWIGHCVSRLDYFPTIALRFNQTTP